jgi:choline monooxygenase
MATLYDFVTAEQIGALNRPTGTAEGLPASVYGEAFYRLENELLFPSCWVAVAVTGDIPEAGDVLPVMLGDAPIVLSRGRDGDIHGFYNICTHRRMRVVTAAAKGRRALSCPWHCWTFGLDGKLLSTPNLGGMHVNECDGFSRENLGLKPVRVATWNDLIVVNLGHAVPFDEHRKPLDHLFRDYDLDDLLYGGRYECTYEGNWKVALEGGIEEYHLPWGHPQSMVNVVDCHDEPMIHGSVYTGTYYLPQFSGGDQHIAQFAPSGLPSLRTRNTDGRPGKDSLYVINLFPTAIIAVNADHVLYALFLPDGPTRTRLVFNYYFHRAAAAPVHAAVRQATLDAWAEIAPQDDDYVRYVFENMKAADTAGVRPRFSPFWEPSVQHFQKIVVDTIQRAEQRRAGTVGVQYADESPIPADADELPRVEWWR